MRALVLGLLLLAALPAAAADEAGLYLYLGVGYDVNGVYGEKRLASDFRLELCHNPVHWIPGRPAGCLAWDHNSSVLEGWPINDLSGKATGDVLGYGLRWKLL